jgi:hypothetical protein
MARVSSFVINKHSMHLTIAQESEQSIIFFSEFLFLPVLF